MLGTATMKMLMDENATEKYNQVQVKKLTVPANEATTKRAALGDIQNRGINRNISTKDVAQKELKDVKARVDTHWKKQPLAVNNSNANSNAVKMTTTTAAPLLRSQSLRTNVAVSTRQNSNNNLRLAAAGKVQATGKPAVKQTKTVVVEEKVNTLRREDSNLTSKSLTKLRAALAKANAPAGSQQQQQQTVTNVAKKEATVNKPQQVMVKKEVAKKEVLPVTTVSLSSQRLANVEDIDADDKENLILVSEYVNDIYQYLYELEIQQPIHVDHLANQLEVSSRMRSVLIDWINEVHMQFHLVAETFHLAVAIIDRYLQVVKNTRRKHLQLVGVTALFIATKYEELFPPAMADFVFITDNTYTDREIRQMELQILKTIDNNLSRPLPIHFLRRYSKAACAEDDHHAMSKYFLELAAMDYDLASYRPSEIAASSLFLSLHLLNGNARAATGFNDKHWTDTLVHYSHYTAQHLRPITRQIAKLVREAPSAKLKSIYIKYQANKFQKISLRQELSSPLLDSIVGIPKK